MYYGFFSVHNAKIWLLECVFNCFSLHIFFRQPFYRFIADLKKSRKKINLTQIKVCLFSNFFFFHQYSRIAGQQGKGGRISLTLFYKVQLLHEHLNVSWEITADSSPLHIASGLIQAGNTCFLSKSPELLSFMPRAFIQEK